MGFFYKILVFSHNSEFSMCLPRRDHRWVSEGGFIRKGEELHPVFPTFPSAFPDKIQHPNANLSWRLPRVSVLLPTRLPSASPRPQPSVPRCPPPRWEQQTFVWSSPGESLPWLVLQLRWTSWPDGSWQGELRAERCCKVESKPSSAERP